MYRHQFQKWGWRKYVSHKTHRSTTTSPPKTQPLNPLQAPYIALPTPMLHVNTTTRHMTIIMTVMRSYMLSDAEHHPHWMTTSPHDNPFPSTQLTHGSAMHFSLLSALEAFTVCPPEPLRGGQFLRRAFRLLDATLAAGTQRLSQYQTFELCGTYPHLLVSRQRTDLAVIWLRYVAARVSVASQGHPLAVMAAHMLGVIGLGEQCEEWLGRLFGMGSEIATALRGVEYRYIFLFWSRWHQGAALDLDEGMRDVEEYYQRLLEGVGRTYGRMHEKYVSLECALLTFASRLGGEFVERTIAGGLDLLERLRRHYHSGIERFGRGWDHVHAKVYLDVYCVLCTLYAKTGRMGDAVETAYELHELISSPGVATDLRDPASTYLVSFELMILDMGGVQHVHKMRSARLDCAHNITVEDELATNDI